MPSQWEDVQGLMPRLVGPLRAWFLGYGSGYEEGVWTPAFAGDSTPGSMTYAALGQNGYYVRVGSLVFATFFLKLSAIAVAPAGNLYIGGLPFAQVAGANAFGHGGLGWDNINLTAGCIDLTARVATGTANIFFLESFDSAPAGFLQGSQIGATSAVTGQVIYRA